jgi:ABC-type enterochelin transport system permease subunit
MGIATRTCLEQSCAGFLVQMVTSDRAEPGTKIGFLNWATLATVLMTLPLTSIARVEVAAS